MARRVDPLHWNVPIVDPQGRPSQEFMRKWERQSAPTNLQTVVQNTRFDAKSLSSLSALLDAAFGNTQGSVLYRDTALWKALGPGASAGLVLTTGGAGANPSWAVPATGALTRIQQIVTSSSQSNITFSSIPATYTNLLLTVIGRATSSTSGTTLLMQFNGDTGNNYAYELAVANGSGWSFDPQNSHANIRIGDLVDASFAAGFASTIRADIIGYAQTTWVKPVISDCAAHKATATNVNAEKMGGGWSSTVAINSIKLFTGAGAFADGTIGTLWGVS